MIYNDKYRATGRTTRALEKLPDNGIYIVAHWQEVKYCEKLLHHIGRDNCRINIIPVSSIQSLRGITRPFCLDHYVHERGVMTDEDWHVLNMIEMRNKDK